MDQRLFADGYLAASTPFLSCIVCLLPTNLNYPLITYIRSIYAFILLPGPFILFHWTVSLNISCPIIFFILLNNFPKHCIKLKLHQILIISFWIQTYISVKYNYSPIPYQQRVLGTKCVGYSKWTSLKNLVFIAKVLWNNILVTIFIVINS